MSSNPAIVSRGNINGTYQLRPGGTADTDQFRIADIDWITTNYFVGVNGNQTYNRCPSPNELYAIPNITTSSPTVVDSATVNDGGSVSNNVGVVSEVGMCLSTVGTPSQYDTVLPQFYSVNVTAGYSWSSNLSYVFTPGNLYYLRAYILYNGVYYYGNNTVTVNTLVTTTTTTLGAGYYDCGYGCQYYAYYPGCTPCNPASTTTTTTGSLPVFGSFGFYNYNVHSTYFYIENDLYSDGGCSLLTRGICYSSTNTTPTISDLTTTMAATTGNFSTFCFGGISPSTYYYVRGYASNCNGLVYTTTILQILTTP